MQQDKRKRRHGKIRKMVAGTAERPRLSIFRSTTAIYAQLIDDVAGITIAAASDLKTKKGGNMESAKTVGLEIAKAAKAKKIETCVFDRGGYRYHGKVKAVAEGAREGGLQF